MLYKKIIRGLGLLLVFSFFHVKILTPEISHAAVIQTPSIPATSSPATTWFAGIGNDGYLTDVNGLLGALSSTPGLQNISVNSFVYSNQSGTAIQDRINDLSSIVGRGDLIFWYYSGHGFYQSDDDFDEINQAIDSYDETIGLKGYSDQITDDDLADALNSLSLKGATIVVILDTCYAGGFIGGFNDLNSVSNLTFLGSSSELEESYANSDDPYSIFTTGLIYGLRDFSADLSLDGIITAREWYDYAYKYTTGEMPLQHPVFWGDETLVIASLFTVPTTGSCGLVASGLILLAYLKRSDRKNSPGKMNTTSKLVVS